MAYSTSALHPREIAFTKTQSARKPSFFGWLLTAMMAARTRQAEREITRYLGTTGGKFTDEAEREIERRFLSNQSHW
jgi:hypothetical protein